MEPMKKKTKKKTTPKKREPEQYAPAQPGSVPQRNVVDSLIQPVQAVGTVVVSALSKTVKALGDALKSSSSGGS